MVTVDDPCFVPREPVFLRRGFLGPVFSLCVDWVKFSELVCFYFCCWLVGGLAFLIDNTFSTKWFERFVRFVEAVDQCK